MSSQRDTPRPAAVDSPSPRASEPEKLVPCMEGAPSRSHTSQDIKTRLNELWGVDGWIPPFPHKITGQNLTVNSFSHRDLQALLSVSNKTARRGIAFPSLYEPRGLIYGLVRKVDGIPKWTDDVAEKAKTRADNRWGKGMPPVASVTHPRVPRSEPTSEQASATASSDISDLLSDDGETPLVEASDDGKEDADLHHDSVNEESRDAPIGHQQDVSNMNHTPTIPPRPVRQLAASNMTLDIPGTRAQLRNGNSLSDEDVKDLIRHMKQFYLQGNRFFMIHYRQM